MNSTTRSLLFWMVLVVVVALIWNLSSQFRAGEAPLAFSEFIRMVDTGQVDRVELTGNEVVGTSSSGEQFRTYAPPPVRGAGQQAHRQQRRGPSEGGGGEPLGDAVVLLGTDPADHRVLGLFHAAGPERRQQGAVVRQEPGQAVLEHAEESDVQRRRRCRRAEGGATGDYRVPPGAAEVPEVRRTDPERRSPHGAAGHREDSAGAGRRR